MTWLGEQPDTVFVGQGVAYPGHGMFKTLTNVPMEKRIELPVMENAQLGMSLGMALVGKTVISIYPRFDFLLLAFNQLINHIDKLEDFTHNQFHARVIIRVGIGARTPLDPGPQHCGDYTEGLSKILKRVEVIRLDKPEQIMPCYQFACDSSRKHSTLMIEEMELYGME